MVCPKCGSEKIKGGMGPEGPVWRCLNCGHRWKEDEE